MKRGQDERSTPVEQRAGLPAVERAVATAEVRDDRDESPAARDDGGGGRALLRGAATAAMGVAIAIAALAAVMALLGTPGCYQTPAPSCGFACGANGACPDDYV
jgi:hypothetical protein